MMNLNLLYSLSHPVEECDSQLNKYTYLAYKYNYPYRIFENKNIWSYAKNINKEEIDSSILSFLEENERVLLFPNIINNDIVQIICRSITQKKFMNICRKRQTFYQIGKLEESYKYYRPIILVEGVADCDFLKTIYPNVLACLTDSISSFNIQLLKSITNNIILGFDNDNAGQIGYQKEFIKLKKNGFSVRKLTHPKEIKDIGDLLQMEKENFNEKLIESYKLFCYNQIQSFC